MPEPMTLKKAELIELKSDFSGEQDDGKRVTVQFNPESLKLTFTNQLVTPEGAGSQQGTPGRLQVGAGTTKLAMQLWFDASRVDKNETPPTDVRDLTKQVTFFITPKAEEGSTTSYIPPAVRFLWGTFHFDGMVDSLEETLDYWSHDGKPLRAAMTLSLSQQKIEAFELAARSKGKDQQIARLMGESAGGAAGRPAGTTPMTQAAAGLSLQALADAAGQGDWQSIASANGIENPRLLEAGQLVNLHPLRQ